MMSFQVSIGGRMVSTPLFRTVQRALRLARADRRSLDADVVVTRRKRRPLRSRREFLLTSTLALATAYVPLAL